MESSEKWLTRFGIVSIVGVGVLTSCLCVTLAVYMASKTTPVCLVSIFFCGGAVFIVAAAICAAISLWTYRPALDSVSNSKQW